MIEPIVRVTYLGHSTVAIESPSTTLLTDPLLRPSLLGLLRRRRPPVDPELLARVDAVLISHVDRDHLDLRSLRMLPAGTPLVAPHGSRRLLVRNGLAPVREVDPGDAVELGDLRVTAVPAAHRPRRAGAPRAAAIGYLIECDSRIYFAGDTDLFEGMVEIARDPLDLALLPIGGWGPTLGPGHLDPARAARALKLLRPRVAVPIHWGTYTPVGAGRLWPWLLESAPVRFAEEAARQAPGCEVRVLEPGQSVAV
jgi:L-ascorbate metabolism protein UlaG (beta-lactamase superfamily)